MYCSAHCYYPADISPDLPQFKANLHSHSNLSDGKLTPEAMAEAYKSRELYFSRTVCYGIAVQVSANYFYIV